MDSSFGWRHGLFSPGILPLARNALPTVWLLQCYLGSIISAYMASDSRIVFLSHSSQDGELTSLVKAGLTEGGLHVVVDPFEPGERTCRKSQQSIKSSTHFIALLTPHAVKSRWVRLEALFAQLCHRRNGIVCIPVCVDKTDPLDSVKELIHIPWESSADAGRLTSCLASRIASTMPTVQLCTDVARSEELKETGRELERRAAVEGDDAILHKAEETYERAVELNYCDHNAWAKLAWVLWKLRENQRAWKQIRMACEISPDSHHVADVQARMECGRRVIGNY